MNKNSTSKSHDYYMERALTLAQKATRAVTPNPCVGAVVVKNGSIVGEGYHQKAGGPHAEIIALDNAADAANGATIYVTLEPCSTTGKTPPCCDAIIQTGIEHVVIGSVDPNPLHAGNGITVLKEAGISVTTDIRKNDCDLLIEDFRKYITTNKPFTIMKVALSADGKIATKLSQSQWITGPDSRAMVQKIRAGVDAILIGANTAVSDDPSLTVRDHASAALQPWRIVLDPLLNIAEDARILHDEHTTKTIIITSENAIKSKQERISSLGIRVIELQTQHGLFNPNDILDVLASLPCVSVLIEGGSMTLGIFADHQCIDKCYFFYAPKIIGGVDAPGAIGGSGVPYIADAIPLRESKWQQFGSDMMLCGYPDWS